MPPDVGSKLVDFCIALRSLNFPIFKEELIGYCNTLIEGTKLVSLFKHGEVRDSWYYNWLRRYHERLRTAAAKPLEVDRERWTTSKNVGKHYQILEQTFVDLGFDVKNPSYSADEPLSESIKFHPWPLGRIVSFDESRFQLDMTDGDKNTWTTIAKECNGSVPIRPKAVVFDSRALLCSTEAIIGGLLAPEGQIARTHGLCVSS